MVSNNIVIPALLASDVLVGAGLSYNHKTMNIWQELKKPFFVLAPMDDVTDTVFRQVVAECARPDLFFTEFVSVDGLQSKGREALLNKLKFTDQETPLIAQIWGMNPDNYAKTSKQLYKMGFAGVDINMGCPVPKVIKLGACSALMKDRPLVTEIIQATKQGRLPVSVKTRLGFNEIDLSWIEFLLEHQLAALTIHVRTVKELSKAPAKWELLPEIIKLRDKISPETLIIGNGDVLSHKQGLELAAETGVGGIMIGRGVFQDPYVFTPKSPWPKQDKSARLKLFARHLDLFIDTWNGNQNPAALKKFAKIYINGFAGASDLRSRLMDCKTAQDMKTLVLSEV